MPSHQFNLKNETIVQVRSTYSSPMLHGSTSLSHRYASRCWIHLILMSKDKRDAANRASPLAKTLHLASRSSFESPHLRVSLTSVVCLRRFLSPLREFCRHNCDSLGLCKRGKKDKGTHQNIQIYSLMHIFNNTRCQHFMHNERFLCILIK